MPTNQTQTRTPDSTHVYQGHRCTKDLCKYITHTDNMT